MTFSFVIPAYKRWDLLHQLLFDIYKRCTCPDEIIVMDNCGTDETFNKGMEWWIETGLLPVEHVINTKEMGFLLNSNKGLKRAKGDVVCLVSTDVRIYQDVVAFPVQDGCLYGSRYIDFDSGWNTFGNKTFSYIEGWLLTATKNSWEELEYFDERFIPYDFEDVALSTKALSLDFTLQSYPDGYASHLGGQSIGYNSERESITTEHKKIFEELWVK